MPSFLRQALRVALGTLVVAVAWAATAGAAQAGVTVVIQPPGDVDTVTISTDDVTGDITDSFRVAKPGGGTQRVQVNKGVSLLQLLRETDTSFNYATISVPRPDGSTLKLTADQVNDPRSQQVFYTDAQGVTRFIGPRQANGVVAARDYFEVSGTVVFTQRNASRLKVSISPKRKKIALGGSVAFRAEVSGNEPDEKVTYDWWLNGKKATRGGSRFTQKFPKKDGVYEFSVTVRIDGAGNGSTAVAKITVGDPDKAKQEQTGSGDSATGGSTGGGIGGSGSGSSYTPSYPPATSIPSTPTPPPPTSAPDPAPLDPPPDIATSGTTVEGNLLADVSDTPPSNILESAAKAAREGKQSDDSADDGAGVPEAALSIAGVLALLGLGAGIENRQGRRLPRPKLRLRLPRRAA